MLQSTLSQSLLFFSYPPPISSTSAAIYLSLFSFSSCLCVCLSLSDLPLPHPPSNLPIVPPLCLVSHSLLSLPFRWCRCCVRLIEMREGMTALSISASLQSPASPSTSASGTVEVCIVSLLSFLYVSLSHTRPISLPPALSGPLSPTHTPLLPLLSLSLPISSTIHLTASVPSNVYIFYPPPLLFPLLFTSASTLHPYFPNAFGHIL